jgi:hypothetical protein
MRRERRSEASAPRGSRWGAGVVQGCEPDFVNDDQGIAEQHVNVAAQAAVEGLGQVGAGEVADLVPGLDRGGAQGHQQVTFADAD